MVFRKSQSLSMSYIVNISTTSHYFVVNKIAQVQNCDDNMILKTKLYIVDP
jgi:hypothetical protein